MINLEGFSIGAFCQITLKNCQKVFMLLFSIHWRFIMDRLTLQQRLQIVKLYNENQHSVKSVFRTLRTVYGQHNRLIKPTIQNTKMLQNRKIF